MKNLEKIHFWESKDGNLNPLLESPSLKTAYITTNKKHYTHTQEEIDNYISNQ